MTWKIFLAGAGVLSTFFISIAFLAVYYDDSNYVAIEGRDGNHGGIIDGNDPNGPYIPDQKPNKGQNHEPQEYDTGFRDAKVVGLSDALDLIWLD